MLQPTAVFFTYIVTNRDKTVLEAGATGDLVSRMYELVHGFYKSSINIECDRLVYWETFKQAELAIKRVQQIRRLSLKRKIEVINAINPEWRFLNDRLSQLIE